MVNFSIRSFIEHIKNPLSLKLKTPKYNIITLGVVGFLGHIFYWILWTYIDPQIYESLLLRLIGAISCLLLLLDLKFKNIFRQDFDLYWMFAVSYNLPFFFTVYLIQNQYSGIWLIAESIVMFCVAMLITNFARCLFALMLGVFSAIAYSFLITPHIVFDKQVISYIPVYFFSLITGFFFSYGNIQGVLAEQALEIQELELKRQKAELEKNEEIIKSEKMAMMGRAVARIAHELNNPISIARMTAQSIEGQTKRFLESSESLDREGFITNLKQYKSVIGKMVSHLVESVNRAAKHVRNFKEITIDQVSLQKKDFQLLDYIRKNLDLNSESLRRSKITVELKGDEVMLYSEAGAFGESIENFLSNSQKYAYDPDVGGKIDIEVKDAGDNVIIIFTDYGKGITPENLLKIYDDFFTTGGGQGGTGLGLGIVYRNVTIKLKGKIVCNSTVGKGTTFIVTVPKITVDDDKSETSE